MSAFAGPVGITLAGGEQAIFAHALRSLVLTMADIVQLTASFVFSPSGAQLTWRDLLLASELLPMFPRVPADLDRTGALDISRLVMVEFAMGPYGYTRQPRAHLLAERASPRMHRDLFD